MEECTKQCCKVARILWGAMTEDDLREQERNWQAYGKCPDEEYADEEDEDEEDEDEDEEDEDEEDEDEEDEDKESLDYIMSRNWKALGECEAFNEMFEGGGHPNYALASYCVEHNHLKCLQEASMFPLFEYHSGIAVVALEHDNKECLQFALEELGSVEIPRGIDIGPNCKDYMDHVYKKYKRKQIYNNELLGRIANYNNKINI